MDDILLRATIGAALLGLAAGPIGCFVLWRRMVYLGSSIAEMALLGVALGLMVLFGTRSIDRKGRARDAEGFARFEAVSSNVPFAAILQGRNRLALGEIALPALAGLAAAFVVAWAHGALFGTPVL